MVVCKFFQQGNCRYGQSCRFEHIFDSKYSYHASSHAQSASQVHQTVTDEQLANQVKSDVQDALRGGQWILSCYAPFKEKPIIPGLSDLSPEEARLFIYEAKASNNLDAAIAFINKLTQETKSKYEQLLQPNMATIKLFRSLYNGEAASSPFIMQNQGFASTDNSATSIFRGAMQKTAFGQNTSNSIFSQNQTPNIFSNQPHNTSIFSNQTDTAKSLFASANQSVFSTTQSPNIFQNSIQDVAQSPFGQANQNVFSNIYPTNPTPMNVFSSSQSVFDQTNVPKQDNVPNVFATSQPGSVFQISDKPTTNIFGNLQPESASVNEDMIYSKMEDLSPSDIEAYESSSFKLGFVPELPPPACLCKM